jgi:aryl-alcohol dehydrogenase-like predicted oxidoreductase
VGKRLALGTVQFGMPYGLANNQGQVNRDEAAAIIARATAAGIDTLDTAVAYGTAEQCLGEIGVSDWRIVTKLPGNATAAKDVLGRVECLVSESLARLRVENLFCMMLHQPSELLGPQGDALYKALEALKRSGLIEKIGISIYSPDQIETICARYAIDLVQAPFNILDRRLIETGWLDRFSHEGIELHARSVFLQGLLLMSPSARPVKFQRWAELWDHWDTWLGENNLTPLAACLRYALSQPGISRVIVGIDSLIQFDQILKAAEGDSLLRSDGPSSKDPDLLNPSRWALI